MKPLFVILLSAWTIAACAAEETATVSVRLRDTSRYTGQPFHFYIQVNGVREAPEPVMEASPVFEIRLTGSSPTTQGGTPYVVFSYEAVPLKSGKLSLPPGTLELAGHRMTIPATPLTVNEPATTDEMQLDVTLSKPECYVGEPIELNVSWTSALSFNGIKAVQFRLPFFGSSQFKINPPVPDIDPKEPGAIGLPVSEERVIAQFSEAQLNGRPAVKIQFRRIVIPVQATSVHLLLPSATLLCSYSAPRTSAFKGARYPSYFNNDFFDQDMTGEYQRFLIRSAPLTLRVLPLPDEGRPADFSGIVGAFQAELKTESDQVRVQQPIPVQLRADGYPFPGAIDLPSLLNVGPLPRQFALPDRPGLPVVEGDRITWSLPIRPLHEQVTAIPALSFNYFDPVTRTYGRTSTVPVPIQVQPAEAVNVAEAKFADGTRLTTEILPQSGGIFHNVTGAEVLLASPAGGWTWPWAAWLLLFVGPPAAWLSLWWWSRPWRLQRQDAELARTKLAFDRFCQTLRSLPEPLDPHRASAALRQYFADRFRLAVDSGNGTALHTLAKARGVDPDALDALEEWLGSAEWAAFSPDSSESSGLGRRTLISIVRQFEGRPWRFRLKSRLIMILAALGLSPAARAAPGGVLNEAELYFQRGNEVAAVDPAKAEQLYRLAASRYETLLREHQGNAGLLYDTLGNTWFLAGDTGRSILSYRRAEPWLRGDARWREALEYARGQRVDSYPLSVTTPAWRRIFFWHYFWSDQMRLQAIGICWSLAWLLGGIRLFRQPPWLIKGFVLSATITVLMVGSNWIHAQNAARKDAVVLAREVIARKGDATIYSAAFTAPLHAGAEVTILEQRRDWLRVRVEDGNEGWIPASAAERIALPQ